MRYPQNVQQLHRYLRIGNGNINSHLRVLEETRDKIRKSVDEARNHIPRYTQIVNDYQEQAIQAAREI